MDRTVCTEPQCLYSTAIPLLPLWTVRPVQSLSACTVELYLYSPYGPTACTEPQCLYSRAIPLLPLWAVRPVQSPSACTRAHFTFYFFPSQTYLVRKFGIESHLPYYHLRSELLPVFLILSC